MMKNKSKSILGISLTILCIFTATLILTACNNPPQNRNDAQPPASTDTSATNLQTPDATGTQDANIISKDDAKKIALEHAGVNETDAQRFRAELDYDDGISVYEVEFDANGLEYDYDINAKTGEIIEFSKERD